MAETTPPCAVCRGAKEEHGPGKTQHVYTTESGQLMTQRQQEQMTRGMTQVQPQVIRLPGAQTNEAQAVGRLVEVLLEKQILSTPEALYIAGMGSKPEVTPPASGYRDPAQQVLPGAARW